MSCIYNTGVTPTGLAITPCGSKLYCCNNNNYGVQDGLQNADSVSVICLKTNTVKTIIRDINFSEPYTATMNKKGSRVYITNSASTTITIIDTKCDTVVGQIVGFDGPSGMCINSCKHIGYVNNYGSASGVGSGNGHTVSVVDL